MADDGKTYMDTVVPASNVAVGKPTRVQDTSLTGNKLASLDMPADNNEAPLVRRQALVPDHSFSEGRPRARLPCEWEGN